jgi:hypothetical protein
MLFSFHLRNFPHKYFNYVLYTKFLTVFGLGEIFVSMQFEIKF